MSASTMFKGINLSGFSDRGKYHHPASDEELEKSEKMMDFYRAKGMDFFRVPIWWDRLQPELNKPFDTTVWDQVKAVVDYGLGLGCTVMVNNHCMGGRGNSENGIKLGDPRVPYGALVDFWRRIATEYKNRNVWFDLINEPHDLPLNGHPTSTDALVTIYNEVIAAIRAEGATNLIVLEGDNWNNAKSFNVKESPSNPNEGPPTSAEAFQKGISDSADNWCVSCHNYPDNPHGQGGPAIDATILRTRFQNVMDWATKTNIKVICGEWSVGADDPNGQAVTTDYLDWLESPENRDKVLAWSWWEGRVLAWEGGKYVFFSDAAPEDPRWAWLGPYLNPPLPE